MFPVLLLLERECLRQLFWGFPGGKLVVKNPPANAGETLEMLVRSLGREDPLEAGMATHSGVLAWRIPRTEEPGGLRPWGCKGLDMTEQLPFHSCL